MQLSNLCSPKQRLFAAEAPFGKLRAGYDTERKLFCDGWTRINADFKTLQRMPCGGMGDGNILGVPSLALRMTELEIVASYQLLVARTSWQKAKF